MVKTRMTAVDLRAVAAELSHKLVGMRLQNIYNINPRTYLLKFGGKPEQKEFVVLEVGSRMHTTSFSYEKPKVPSAFTLKLRKHIRQWRLDHLRQLGVDRVIDFCFGTGENAFHLIVEFYAKGNLILTDADMNILALVRTHSTEDSRYAVRSAYPLDDIQHYRPMTMDRIEEAIRHVEENEGTTLKAAFTGCTEFGPALVEHCLLKAGVKASLKKAAAVKAAREAAPALLAAFEEADAFLKVVPKTQGFLIRKAVDKEKAEGAGKAEEKEPPKDTSKASSSESPPQPSTGGGTEPEQANGKESKPDEEGGHKTVACDSSEDEKPSPAGFLERPEQYEDFAPMRYLQHEAPGLEVKTFPTFNMACDYYFSAVDQDRIVQHNAQKEKTVLSKVERARLNNQKRVQALEHEQETNRRKARLIEENIDEVEQALQIIRSAVAQAVNWDELSRIIKNQKRAGNPIAAIIHELKLDRNRISLLLTEGGGGYAEDDEGEEDEEGEEKEEDATAEVVDVDISLSAHANARTYFEHKKKAQVKQMKTEAAESKALKSAARKAEKEAARQGTSKKDLTAMRKPMWFEKFNWFITTENYLVIAGRDAQQNEMLVKRYFRKGDLYVHGDIHGAATAIVKNPSGEAVPLATLCQAGSLAVCRSSAWDSNIVISAWWVHHHQVSKTAPSGEYMPTGSFMIRGKKNYLPPTKLQMGAGLLFRVHEEHVARHKDERKCAEAAENMGAAPPSDDDSLPRESSAMSQPLSQPDEEEAKEEAGDAKGDASLLQRFGLQSDAYQEGGKVIAISEEKEAEEEEAKKDTSGAPVTKKRMSAKERRMLKKKRSAGGDKGANEESDDEGEESEDDDGQQSTMTGKSSQPQRQLTRAERRKQRKMAKYKDQDPEERDFRMRLCGWDGGINKAIREAEKEQDEQEDEEAKIIRRVRIQELGDDEAFNVSRKPAEEKEVTMEVSVLDSLTGIPFEDDLLLFPVVMVGPYEAVQNFKYKVCVLPGKEKKGKAAQAVLHAFSQHPEGTEQEKGLLKQLDVQDCINVLPSNLRITASPEASKTGSSKKGAPEKKAKKTKKADSDDDNDHKAKEKDKASPAAGCKKQAKKGKKK